MLNLSDNPINKLHLGDSEVRKMYLGDRLAYEGSPVVFVVNKKAPIACIGDSLTYGQEDGSQTPQPSHLSLAASTGIVTFNRGIRGYVPRHRVWDFLIQDGNTIQKSDLLDIPPSQWEDRIHQTSNNLRTFYANGQQVWVHESQPDDPASVLYQFDSSSTATPDGDNVLLPSWAGSGNNNPEYLTGRWIKQAGTYPGAPVENIMASNFVYWLGANGMEVDDVLYGVELLTRHLPDPDLQVFPLTLANRQPWNADPAVIAEWTVLTDAVNDALFSNYRGSVIDIDGYFMSEREYSSSGFVPRDANDEADIALGVVARSIKDEGETGSHFTAEGYQIIAEVVGDKLATGSDEIFSGPAFPMASTIRYWCARGLVEESGGVVDKVGSFNSLAEAVKLVASPDVVGANYNLTGINGSPSFVFTGAGAQGLQCIYGAAQSQPSTHYMVIRVSDLTEVRGDFSDFPTASGNNRHLIRYIDDNGTRFVSMFAGLTTQDGPDLVDNDWHVIVCVFDGNNSYVWFDGTQYGPYPVGAAATDGIRLGAHPPNGFAGEIAEYGHKQAVSDSTWVAEYTASANAKFDLS